MRNNFEQELQLLHEKLTAMGGMCDKAIACAVKALLENDRALAENAYETEREIDSMERDIERLCLKLILRQQPVAKDLREISAALKMITDMERIGDQAADIAELTNYADLSVVTGAGHISAMAKATVEMVTNSIESFVQKDESLAREVIAHDDVVDDLFSKIKSEIILDIVREARLPENVSASIDDIKKNSEAEIDLLMIAKYLERIGDHATNIAEWVLFSITGTR